MRDEDDTAQDSLSDIRVYRRTEIEFPALSVLENHWKALSKGRTVPFRSAVNPRKIEDALDISFIVERTREGVIRFRLSGVALNDMMGMDVRGMPLTGMFDVSDRDQLLQDLDQVFRGPATARMRLRSPKGYGRPPLDGQMVLFPMRDDLGQINRALGGLATIGPIGQTPRRLKILGSALRRVAVDKPSRAFQAGQSAFAEPSAPFQHQNRPIPPKGRPNLYVVSSNERFDTDPADGAA